MRLATRLSSWVVLLSATSLGAAAQDTRIKSAATPEATLSAAKAGFDDERQGIERGRVETVEYDSKTVGARRKVNISQRFHSLLEEKGVPHIWYVETGGHTWPVWKNDLYLLSQRLFRDGSFSAPATAPPAAVAATRTQASATAPQAAVAATRPQTPASRRPTTPNDTLKSVEVAPDHKVTFRIYAPKADDVSVSGDFGAGGKLTKDEQGIWSITVGPLTPDFYSYTFNVDGVRTVDPKNPMIKPGISSLDNMMLVPGAEAEFESTKDVPHGEIRTAWYHSNTLDSMRSMHVYTPPGYDSSTEKLPVFYLLHGGGDDDLGWSTIGRAGFIVDNLLAAKKAVPMIVVMPNGSMPRPANMPRFTPGSTPSPEARSAMEAFQNRFTNELLKDIIPFTEAHYRVKTGRDNRALAGLSMGGGQTLRVLTANPDQFGQVGIWSAGLFGGNADEFEKRNESFFKAADHVNKTVKLLSVCVGDKDFALEGSKALVGLLDKNGIKHEVHISGGGHTWINWRHYLNELVPRLFR